MKRRPAFRSSLRELQDVVDAERALEDQVERDIPAAVRRYLERPDPVGHQLVGERVMLLTGKRPRPQRLRSRIRWISGGPA